MAPCTTRDLSDQRDQPAELAQKHPQVAQDHADVVTAAVQHREEVVPLSGHLARRPSVFICPIIGSMAPRRC